MEIMKRVNRRLVGAVAVVVLAAALAAGLFWITTEDVAPTGAASSVVATAHAPVTNPATLSEGGVAPSQQCLSRIEKPNGYLDLCWQSNRILDGDPDRDYYWLNLYGSTFGNGSQGLHWMVLRTKPSAASPATEVMDTTPDRRYDGDCGQIAIRSIAGYSNTSVLTPTTVDACNLTKVDDSAFGQGVASLSWVCQHCLFPSSGARGVGFFQAVAVPQGTIPVWDIYADIG